MSDGFVIRVLGLANGESMHGAEGQFLLTYTPDGHGGRGDLVLTRRRADAKRYPDAGAAMLEWKRVSSTHPKRPDGKPNRPLSAFTIAVESARGKGSRPHA
jgi:hypothetical protein